MFCDFIVTNRPKEYLFFLKYSKDRIEGVKILVSMESKSF